MAPFRRRGRPRPAWPRAVSAAASLSLVTAAFVVAPLPPDAPTAGATSPPATVEAWLYPGSTGEPTCDASAELARLATAPVALLKPQYLTVDRRGRVGTDTAAELPCNGFSAANLALVRAAAQRVFVTVSAGRAGVRAVLSDPTRQAAALAAVESFVSSAGLDGVDLDFEPGRWPAPLWQRYMSFVGALTGALAAAGGAVEVDLDAFSATPWDAERYGDVAAAGAHLVIMAYDHEYDVACSPVTPFSWLRDVVTYAQSQVAPGALTIGLPAYGYRARTCTRVAKVTSNVPYVTMESAPGFPATDTAAAAVRDPSSGELRWTSGGVQYDVVDSTALNDKLQLVESLGATDVSVWSLGGEPWFSGNPA